MKNQFSLIFAPHIHFLCGKDTDSLIRPSRLAYLAAASGGSGSGGNGDITKEQKEKDDKTAAAQAQTNQSDLFKKLEEKRPILRGGNYVEAERILRGSNFYERELVTRLLNDRDMTQDRFEILLKALKRKTGKDGDRQKLAQKLAEMEVVGKIHTETFDRAISLLDDEKNLVEDLAEGGIKEEDFMKKTKPKIKIAAPAPFGEGQIDFERGALKKSIL